MKLLENPKQLDLAAKDNSHINNRIGINGKNPQQISRFIGFPRKFPNIVMRSENTDQYNCHGLVFASRRTNIDDSNEVKNILDKDEYMEIEPRKVLPGDIIIYYAEDGDAEHSGVVISKPDTEFYIPRIEAVPKLQFWNSFFEFCGKSGL
ncbi:MAG: hypothetical protein LBK66_04885 [Spirochaetaceae bacterium]|nr:hypothetical protein [Spirochaetaceae bacterium]